MFYYLYCSLIMAGYSACGLLLGSYMMHYAGARELDLGYVFMIQPMTIFARPFICAQADRYQSHRQLLCFFALLTAISYSPFILLPFFLHHGHADHALGWLLTSERARFWLLVLSHLLGSVGFCGVRSLGDALTVNFAKRVGSEYARYRKFGALSFGLCGYLLGFVNQDSPLPDFVPSMLVYSLSFLVLALLAYLWPEEYFEMRSQADNDNQADSHHQLPQGSQLIGHMANKLCCFKSQGHSTTTTTTMSRKAPTDDDHHHQEHEEQHKLTFGQQMRIFLLLIKRDFRIPAFLFAIFYGGLVGYAGPNFVFTYMNEFCRKRATCNGAQLAGLVMISYCLVETICYMILDRLHAKLANRSLLLLEITFLSLMVHYYFYGYLLEHLSPFFFLVESLHGVEYSISLTTSLQLGYQFANQVEQLIPELLERQVINEKHHSLNNYQLVRLSLMATMSGCCTLVYDGLGCLSGCFIYGLVTGHFSFLATWRLIGTLGLIGAVMLLVAPPLGRCLGLKSGQIVSSNSGNLGANLSAQTLGQSPAGGVGPKFVD